jgi:hypothetical protein
VGDSGLPGAEAVPLLPRGGLTGEPAPSPPRRRPLLPELAGGVVEAPMGSASASAAALRGPVLLSSESVDAEEDSTPGADGGDEPAPADFTWPSCA